MGKKNRLAGQKTRQAVCPKCEQDLDHNVNPVVIFGQNSWSCGQCKSFGPWGKRLTRRISQDEQANQRSERGRYGA